MSELKPCPFCGGDAQMDRMGTNKVSMQISCGYCGAYMESGETWIDENSNWNQRVETETEKRPTAIATKHATVNDESYELLEKQKSDIEKMLDQLFKHEKVDAWLVCKMNDMLDDVNYQLDKSRIEAEKSDGIYN